MEDTKYRSAYIMNSWTKRFGECHALYHSEDSDKLELCVETVERELSDDTMPLWFRMRFSIMLGGLLEDWREAQTAIDKCNWIWHAARKYQDTHDTAERERVMAGLTLIRGMLDVLERRQVELRPEGMEDEDDVEEDDVEEDDVDEEGADEEDSDPGWMDNTLLDEEDDDDEVQKAGGKGYEDELSTKIKNLMDD